MPAWKYFVTLGITAVGMGLTWELPGLWPVLVAFLVGLSFSVFLWPHVKRNGDDS